MRRRPYYQYAPPNPEGVSETQAYQGRRVSETQAYSSGRAGSRERGETVSGTIPKRAFGTPCHDQERGELRLGSVVVKHFTQESDAQGTILRAFQDENGPPCIDDPLSGKEGQDPKQRLRTA